MVCTGPFSAGFSLRESQNPTTVLAQIKGTVEQKVQFTQFSTPNTVDQPKHVWHPNFASLF